MSGKPWSKFWWKSWLADMELRSCSVAARGLWMDMLCIASEGEPYGHLTVGGKPMSVAQLARTAGMSPRECEKLMQELRDAGVFSETETGVIYSRRMVRDNDASETGKRFGRKGGNPALIGSDAPPDNSGGYGGGITPPDKLEDREDRRQRGKKELSPPPSLANAEHAEPSGPLASLAVRSQDSAEFQQFWQKYPRREGKGAARKAFDKARKSASFDAILAALDRSWSNDPRFIPHPATWLNQQRWLDEIDTSDPVLRAAGLDNRGNPIARPAAENCEIPSPLRLAP